MKCESDLAARFDVLDRVNVAAAEALTIFGDGGAPVLDIAAEATACVAQSHAEAHFQVCYPMSKGIKCNLLPSAVCGLWSI
jgi:hypothetical protein